MAVGAGLVLMGCAGGMMYRQHVKTKMKEKMELNASATVGLELEVESNSKGIESLSSAGKDGSDKQLLAIHTEGEVEAHSSSSLLQSKS